MRGNTVGNHSMFIQLLITTGDMLKPVARISGSSTSYKIKKSSGSSIPGLVKFL